MPVPTRVARRAVVVPFLLVAGLVGTGLAPAASAAPALARTAGVASAAAHAAQAPSAVSAKKAKKKKKNAKVTRVVPSRVGRNQGVQIYARERPAVPKRIVRVAARQAGGAWRSLGDVRERKHGKAYALVAFPSSGNWEVQVRLLKHKKHGKKFGRSFPVHVVPDFQPQVVAHRGGAGEAGSENTMAAYERAVQLGYTAIETDVQETFDDPGNSDPAQLILMHDSTYARTTNSLQVPAVGNLQVNEVPARNLVDVRGKDGRPVPRFSQLLQLVKDYPGVTLHAEAKRPNMGPGIEQMMYDEIVAAGLKPALDSGRIIISSFDLPTLQTFRAIDASAKLSLITSRYADLSGSAASTVNSITLEQPAATTAAINDAHARGYPVYVWTVDDPAFFYRFADARADAIITDIPGSARANLLG